MKKKAIVLGGIGVLCVFAVMMAIKSLPNLVSPTPSQGSQEILPDGSTVKKDKIIAKYSSIVICDDNVKGGVHYFTLNEAPPFALSKKTGKYAFLNFEGKIDKLFNAISASGAKYVDATQNLMFWSKGETVYIERAGKRLYKECTLVSSPWNAIFNIKFPDMESTAYIVGAIEEPMIKAEYAKQVAGETERGAYILYTKQRTRVSKVGDIDNETWFAVPLVTTTQGTGNFWSIVLFVQDHKSPSVYTYLDSYFLGDRIQDLTVSDQIGQVDLSFYDYAPTQPYSEKPSVLKNITLGIDGIEKKFILRNPENN